MLKHIDNDITSDLTGDIIDIQSIMRLFQGSPFPRTVSTYATEGRQVLVSTTEEMLTLFEQAKFVDCRINAFPVGNINADFVMADLDLSKFRTEQMLIKALDKTVDNITKDLPGTTPTVLQEGGIMSINLSTCLYWRRNQSLDSLIIHRRSLYDMLRSDGPKERTMLVTSRR